MAKPPATSGRPCRRNQRPERFASRCPNQALFSRQETALVGHQPLFNNF